MEYTFFKTGEPLIARVNAASNGKWPETWITYKGVHTRKVTDWSFVPFTDISGVHYEYEIKRQERMKMLRGREIVVDISLNKSTTEIIRDAVAKERIRCCLRKTPSRRIDESELQRIVQSNTLSLTKGIFGQRTVQRFAPQGKQSLENLIGEGLRPAFGEEISRKGYYKVNPTFYSNNWIIQIQEGKSGLQAVVVCPKDMVFYYSFLQYNMQTLWPGGRDGNSNDNPSHYPETVSSSCLVYTPYSTKQFSPPIWEAQPITPVWTGPIGL